MRIGQGFDAHCFEDGKPLVVGGVRVPYDQGLKAHSDGDVLIHALCDALLGAVGAGDIGQHFPDTSAEFLNIDSRILLQRVMSLVMEKGFRVVNADTTIIAQVPKFARHIPSMRQVLAQDLQIDPSVMNVKATTTEQMGFTGRKEGIAAMAVVLLDACL
jgi:2-C-methyl-D-erythritol 2,4-cyclodiphosphate synthase